MKKITSLLAVSSAAALLFGCAAGQSHEGTSLQSDQAKYMSTVTIVSAGLESFGLGAHLGARVGTQQIDHDAP